MSASACWPDGTWAAWCWSTTVGRSRCRSTSCSTSTPCCCVATRGPSWTWPAAVGGSRSRSMASTRRPAPAGASWSAGRPSRSPIRLSSRACGSCRCTRGRRAPSGATSASCPHRSPDGGSRCPRHRRTGGASTRAGRQWSSSLTSRFEPWERTSTVRRSTRSTMPASSSGAELELFLVDEMARPLPHNQAVRAAAADARVNVELDRFNLELNATPTLLAGRPFAALGEELRLLLGRVADAAGKHGGRPVLVGILPTLRRADLGARVISDLPRYRALNRRLRLLRHDPFHLRITGADPLELASDDVALEGAATSFQVHLRVDPADFARSYNAVQAATAPVLAVAGNSPTLLGHRLWEETRIPLCKQS